RARIPAHGRAGTAPGRARARRAARADKAPRCRSRRARRRQPRNEPYCQPASCRDHFLRCHIFGRKTDTHPGCREGGLFPENAPVEAPRVKLIYAMIALAAACNLAAAQGVPMPRPRPPAAPALTEEAVPPEAAPPTACRLRLTAALATAPTLPRMPVAHTTADAKLAIWNC